MELDPIYLDVSVRRFEKLTAIPTIHAGTGLSFADVEVQRLGASSCVEQKGRANEGGTSSDKPISTNKPAAG